MKILMIVNWPLIRDKFYEGKIEFSNYFDGNSFWMFRSVLAKNDSINVISVYENKKIARFEKKFFGFYVFQILKWFRKMKAYDVIITHGADSGILLAFFRRFVRTKYKHVLFDIGSFRSGSEKNTLIDRFVKFASKSIDFVFYHSSMQKEYYAMYFPWIVNKSCFIKFGVDNNFFTPCNNVEKKYSGICIGAGLRDWDTLFEALKNVNLKKPFLIVGNNNLKVPCNLNVLLIDKCDIISLKKLISLSLIGVLPLKEYKFSYGQMTLLDLYAMGIPVIAAKTFSLTDYGVNDETCLFYTPCNAVELSNKINILINDSNLRTKISNNALKYVENFLNEKRMGAEVYDCIKGLTNQAK